MSANSSCVNYSSGLSSFNQHRKPQIRYINAIDLMTQIEEKQISSGKVIERSTILEDLKKYKLDQRKYTSRITQPDNLKPLPTVQSKRVYKSNLRPRASSKFEIDLPTPSPTLKISSPTVLKPRSVSPIAAAEMYLDNLIKNRQEISMPNYQIFSPDPAPKQNLREYLVAHSNPKSREFLSPICIQQGRELLVDKDSDGSSLIPSRIWRFRSCSKEPQPKLIEKETYRNDVRLEDTLKRKLNEISSMMAGVWVTCGEYLESKKAPLF
jgi:hypothetical protein